MIKSGMFSTEESIPLFFCFTNACRLGTIKERAENLRKSRIKIWKMNHTIRM